MKSVLLATCAIIATSLAVIAAQPEPFPEPPAITAPRDVAWPGTVALDVDITDLDRHVMRVHETIPVQKAGQKAGQMVLLYPQWVPGDHGPTGPLANLAGLTITANGAPVAWTRDVVDVHAFHIDVPQGASLLDVHFEYLSPVADEEGRVEMTPDMVDLAWNTVTLYPAGIFTRDLMVHPVLTLPKGWHYGTALETETAGDGIAQFKPVPFNTLVDSPLYAGRYFNRLDLAPGAATQVHLDVVADRPQDLEVSADQLAKHRALVQQAVRTFGSQHYNHYDFLLALSDQLGGVGLEHHRSSENGVERGYFTDWDKDVADRDLLPHEYTHSWNGKFRRPADLWAPNFNIPERDSLLWVYEGQTQFWGQILAARSGLWTSQEARDALAEDAASMQSEIGRVWRPLQDTTNDPVINERRPQSWHSWEREEDYYTEGLLIWLDVDQMIREKTQGRKSLDDFARGFFGIDNGSFVTVTYRFDDVVHALNDVVAYDWSGFLRQHLDRTSTAAPLDGLARGGWRLVYTDQQSAFSKSESDIEDRTNFNYSIGLFVRKDNSIGNVVWDSPAYKAGLVKGGKIIAINGLAYQGADDLAAAITLAKHGNAVGGGEPISILVQEDQHFRTVPVVYHDGLRYPHLERIPGRPDLLDALLKPLG